MGCDIHLVVERKATKKPNAKWIGTICCDYSVGGRIKPAQRDYDFFAEVANVRGRGTHFPRNIPEDVSDLAWQQYMECPTDYHSASHMPLSEFCDAYLKVNPEAARKEFAANDLFGIWNDEDKYEWRVVFWFDN